MVSPKCVFIHDVLATAIGKTPRAGTQRHITVCYLKNFKLKHLRTATIPADTRVDGREQLIHRRKRARFTLLTVC